MKSSLQKILYVEDEEDIRAITKIALEDIGGLTIESCNNGREALLAAEHFSPDLLLLDVMMPGIDGVETLKELRKLQNTKNTPAIFMTAKVQESEILLYKKLGVIEVIAKPFEPMTLADTLRQSWDKII